LYRAHLAPGERLYRTGDIGRYLATASGVFWAGRSPGEGPWLSDRAGEIEAALVEQEGVEQGGRFAREDAPGARRRLVGMWLEWGIAPDASELRAGN